MERIDYNIADRGATLATLDGAGKVIREEAIINLNQDGIPQTCYFIVEDAPAPQPDLLALADERILALEYENIMLKEGLAV